MRQTTLALKLRLQVIAPVAFTLILSTRIAVLAQTQNDAPQVATACVSNCAKTWGSLLQEAYYPRRFLEKFQNSSAKAADYFCGVALNVTGCYSKCKTDLTNFELSPLDSFYAESSASAVQLCTTDNGNCRAIESRLWCNAYSPNTCTGQALQKNKQCIRHVQERRGCSLINPRYASQKAVLTTMLDAHLSCFEQPDVNYHETQIQQDTQACIAYTQTVCLAPLSNESSITYSSYYNNDFQCSTIKNIQECVHAAEIGNITINNFSYKMPCKTFANRTTMLRELSSLLSTLVPRSCFSTTAGALAASISGFQACHYILLIFALCLLLLTVFVVLALRVRQ